jgi:hypothetical protein
MSVPDDALDVRALRAENESLRADQKIAWTSISGKTSFQDTWQAPV